MNYPYRHYGLYAGISIGAINAGFLAQAKRGELRDYARRLKELWFSVRGSQDIYSKTIFGILRNIWSTGTYNIDPLRKLIEDNFDVEKVRSAGNSLRFGTVNLLTGIYVEATEYNSRLIDYMIASAALPFAFPVQAINNGLYTDGGIRSTAAYSAAIDLGYTEMDLIITSPLKYDLRVPQITKKEMKNSLHLGLRLLTIMHEQIFISNMMLLQRCNELALLGDERYRYIDVRIYAPRISLSTDVILTTFDPITIKDWFMHGKITKPVSLEDYVKNIRLVQKITK
jgi:predicted acylesterase/phospholipase RssA